MKKAALVVLALALTCVAGCGGDGQNGGVSEDAAADGSESEEDAAGEGPGSDAQSDAAGGADGGLDTSLGDASADGASAGDASPADSETHDSADPGAIGPGYTLEPVAATQALRHLYAFGDQMLGVGDGGAIFRFNGGAWVPQAAPTKASLFGVWGHAGGEAYAVGEDGTLLYDDGQGWQLVDVPVSVDLFGVHARDPGEVFAVGDKGIVLRGAGDTWTIEDTNWQNPLHAIWVNAQGIAFAATTQSQVLRRVNEEWITNQAAPSGTTLLGLGGLGDEVIAVGTGGALARWSGASWTVEVSNDFEGRDLYGVWILPDGSATAVGDRGAVVEWDGATWTTRDVLGPLNRLADLRAVAGIWHGEATAPVRFAAGLSGHALRTTDEPNQPWVDTAIGLDADLHDIWVSADSALAVGDAGVALSLRPAGWSGEATGTLAHLHGLWREGNRWYAVGESGTVCVREAGAWSTIEPPSTSTLRGVCGRGEALWVVGDKGRIFRRSGGEWIAEDSPWAGAWNDVWPLSDGRLAAVGEGGAVAIRDADGQWELVPVSTSSALRRVWGAADAGASDVLYVVGDHGAVLVGPPGDLALVSTAPLEFLYGVWAPVPGEAIAVGWAGLLWGVRDSQIEAVELETERVLEAVMGVSADAYYVVGRRGTLLRYQRPAP